MTKSDQQVRPPAVAGRFYEADPTRCSEDATHFCTLDEDVSAGGELPAHVHGAIVPHAGWVCSGRIAGKTLAALSERTNANTFILTGSIHTMAVLLPTLETADAWATPLGPIEVDTRLRDAMASLKDFTQLDMAHQYEHSLEVQLPLMQTALNREFRIVPCLIPPHPNAHIWGESLGQLLKDWSDPVALIASTDFTHYGPNYQFSPHGDGDAGIEWAHEVNDARLLEMIREMQYQSIVAETQANKNACGGGSIAATLAACKQLGAERAFLLEHSNSTRELDHLGHADHQNSVGYAGMLIG